MVKVELASDRATDETVPDKQVPLIETHPPERESPLLNVLVADVPVTDRYGVESPEAMVEVAFDKMEEVAVPFCEIERTVVDAFPNDERPVTVTAPSVPRDVSDELITLVPNVVFESTLVLLI